MSLINKLFKKTSTSTKPARQPGRITEHKKEENKIESETKKPNVFPPKADHPMAEKSDILLSPLATEKAVSGQSLNKYIFKVAPKVNKIDIKRAVGRAYNVKAVSVNIVNIPGRTRRVGKTIGWKSGYKKAVVTLAKGQSIEVK